jgi:hypothetical protein
MWNGRRRRRNLPLTAAAALSGVLALVAYGASAASPPTLTPSAVQITDHPAYVQVVVDFTGAGLTMNQMRASDPDPFDGTAALLISYPNVVSRVAPVTGHGLSVRVVEVPYGLSVGIGVVAHTFKYLSYDLVGRDELAVDVWKSTFLPAGDIARGPGGCLTLSRVSAAAGMVSAAGTARGLFEGHFRVLLRDSFGQVLASGSLSASGRWTVTLRYSAPQGQAASLEAAASSAKDGALTCLVQHAFALPASNPGANLHVVHRAYADINGDGRRDLVTLRRTSASKGQLTVALAGGGRVSVTTPSDAVWLPGLVATGNVDGRPGEELFVDVVHVTTAESIAIYSDWHGALVRAGTLPAYGEDYGVLFGITCSAQGRRHFVTGHSFYIKPPTHRWMRQDTVYVWNGPALKLLTRQRATRIPGEPSAALVGVQCGHLPTAAPARAAGQARARRRGATSMLAGTWRRLPAAPSPQATAMTVSVWTGSQMVIFGRAYPRPPAGVDIAAAYTPATNRWRRLVALAGPTGNFQGEYHAVWTGTQMLVLGPDDFQAYEPRTNRWRRPAPPPAAVAGAGLVLWTGKEMIDWGGGCCGGALSTGWAFNPVTSRWRKLPSSPLAPSQVPAGVWTGRELIVLATGIDPDGKPYPARFAASPPTARRPTPGAGSRRCPRLDSAPRSSGMDTRCS